jgi:predicted RNA binding protein YcfA (HicA-like mRNA interferase family)
MRPVSGKRMCKLLELRGWVLIGREGSHRLYFLPTARVKIPVPVHGNHDLATGTQRSIMRQAGLTDADL